MKVYDTILKRRSIRKFTKQDISLEMIEKLLKAGMAAPSARNKQPWELFVITNQEVLKNLRDVGKNFDYPSPLNIIVCGNTKRSITQNDNDFWIQDCSAVVQNILLCATDLGLGSLWCGIYPVLERTNLIKKILKVEEHIVPMALIHIGYPDESKDADTKYNDEYIHYIK